MFYEQRDSAGRSLVVDESSQFTDMRNLGAHWTFQACSEKTMGLTTDLTIFETITASRVCGYSMIHQKVHD